MELEIWDILKVEQDLLYTKDERTDMRTGCIGHLRGDMDTNGNGFFTSWTDHMAILKTDAFKQEFDDVIHMLRFHPDYDHILRNRTDLAKYCYTHPNCQLDTDSSSYGIRVDTEEYSYLVRLNPGRGVYNVYIYCYLKKALDKYISWLHGTGYLAALDVAEMVLEAMPEEKQQALRDAWAGKCILDGKLIVNVYKEGFMIDVEDKRHTIVFSAYAADHDGDLVMEDRPADPRLLWDFTFDHMPINPATMKRYGLND